MHRKRTYFHGEDFHPCMCEIDRQLNMMTDKKYLSVAIRNVRIQFPAISESTMRRRYKEWCLNGKNDEFIYQDKRNVRNSQKALSIKGEILIADQILEMNRLLQQVTFQVIRELAIEQWKKENNINPFTLFQKYRTIQKIVSFSKEILFWKKIQN